MSSIMQARFSEDEFPVGRFILDRARDLGFSRTDLVWRLGYSNIGKGHSALSGLLKTGVMPPIASTNLAGALEVDQAILDAVILATAQQQHDTARAQVLAQEEAYRAAFRSHLQVKTERRVPSPIFVASPQYDFPKIDLACTRRIPPSLVFYLQGSCGRDQSASR